MNDFYKLTFKDAVGKEIPMGEYQGKVLLLVNTATKCGLAPQFTDIEALYQQYKNQGLVVIGFPSNQFSQEPESNETVVEACQVNFGVTFLLSEKIDVNGSNAHPLFTYLKQKSRSMLGRDIKWNFTKFLVSRDSKTVKRFAPTTKPNALRADIEKLLA